MFFEGEHKRSLRTLNFPPGTGPLSNHPIKKVDLHSWRRLALYSHVRPGRCYLFFTICLAAIKIAVGPSR